MAGKNEPISTDSAVIPGLALLRAGSCAVIAAVIWIAPAECAKVYRFTGEVTQVKGDSVTVRRGGEQAEFARPKDMGKIHPGDRITVLYSMDAQQILQAPQSGGAAPESGGKKQHLILDDRAFYNARNQVHPSSKNPG